MVGTKSYSIKSGISSSHALPETSKNRNDVIIIKQFIYNLFPNNSVDFKQFVCGVGMVQTGPVIRIASGKVSQRQCLKF